MLVFLQGHRSPLLDGVVSSSAVLASLRLLPEADGLPPSSFLIPKVLW